MGSPGSSPSLEGCVAPAGSSAATLRSMNAGDDAVDWVLPTLPGAPPWGVLLDTATDDGTGAAPRAGRIRVQARSLLLLAAG